MFNRPITSFALVTALFFSTAAQSAESLQELYKQISGDIKKEATHNTEREKKFKAAADQQKAMLADVKAKLAAQQKLREQLKTTFDANETELAEITTLLDQRTGNLGELFGVFRQMAGDTQSLMVGSLITAQYPERLETIDQLASSKEVPTIPQMQSLWELMLQEVSASGEVTDFSASVVQPNGDAYTTDVTRVGTFNVVTGDKYLTYNADSGKLVELARQPSGAATSTAAELTSASSGSVDFMLDPSRGALLGLLVQAPSLIERVQQGREVGYAIIVVGIIGLLFALMRYMALTATSAKIRAQLKNMENPTDNNPLGRMMIAFYENKHLNDLDVITKKLEEVIFKELTDMKKGLATIKVLAAIAPLMGLLGTVTGMIGTFQAITLFGTGDPKLMAGGISQALITTVLGLCAAIPLLLASNALNSRNQQLSKLIGEQASGMIAEKAAEIAARKKAA